MTIARLACIALALATSAWSGCTVHTVPASPPPEPPPEPEGAAGQAEPEGGPMPDEGDPVEEAPDDLEPAEPLPDDGPAAGGAVKVPRDLRPAPPVSCSGSRDVRLVGRSIVTDGHAIEISGSCDVVIERSHIRAGGVAIMISGSGDVTVRDSVVQGRLAAVVISGSGEVRAEGTRFIGRRDVSGSGELIDNGGNRWR